jgi:hypothetical protein
MAAVNPAPVAPLARFEFGTGPLRGSELVLYRTSLVHRGKVELETLQLAAIAALRVAFARDTRGLGWGIGLIVAALLFLVISGPVASSAAHAVADLTSAGGQGVARALISFFRVIEAIGSFLPVVALLCAVGGAALIVRGWQGSTTLTLNFAGFERSYAARGRDPLLLDFADALSARLMSPER